MATTEQYLTQLQTDKTNLVANLVEKGVEASDTETFTSLVPKVLDIQGGSSKYAPRCISFRGYTGTELDQELASLDTSNMTDMEDMFSSCNNLTNLDVSNFNTSNVTTMGYMFSSCKKLTDLDVSNFDTSKVTSIVNMFSTCTTLTSLDLSNWDTSNVNSMTSMCDRCTSIITLNLGNFDASKVIRVSSAFVYLNALTTLIGSLKDIGKAYTQPTANYSYYGLNFVSSTNLTHESLMNIINGLYDLNLSYDVANGGTLYTQNLRIGDTNIAKLTAEEIAIVTNKGWNLT